MLRKKNPTVSYTNGISVCMEVTQIVVAVQFCCVRRRYGAERMSWYSMSYPRLTTW